jgi:hypothetical protein
MQVTDAELVEAFLGQDDRRTYSGKMLSDCFSPTQFDLAFQYGSVVQRSAVRHALIACLSLPAPDPRADLPVRYATFEKHLGNLLVHSLRSIAGDAQVARPERVAANLLVEAAWFRNNFEVASRSRRSVSVRSTQAGTGRACERSQNSFQEFRQNWHCRRPRVRNGSTARLTFP